jgi:hypothetical protein
MNYTDIGRLVMAMTALRGWSGILMEQMRVGIQDPDKPLDFGGHQSRS